MKLVVGNQKTYLNRFDVIDFINNTSDVDCSRAVVPNVLSPQSPKPGQI